uniref:glutaminase n=1 Tax=Romanomermis culicivorax TaxID=13658 RepID=A0A915LB80_ROMCU
MVSTVDKNISVNGNCSNDDGGRCEENIFPDHLTNGKSSIDTKKLSFNLENSNQGASCTDNGAEILSRNEWFSIFHDKIRNKRKSIGMKNIEEDSKSRVISSLIMKTLAALTSTGIRKYDTRLKDTMTKLKIFQTANGADFDSPDALMLNETQFKEVIGANIVFIDTILRNRFVIPEFKSFCDELQSIYEICKSMSDGSLCEYIPQLSKCSESLWAVSVCTVDGQRFSAGDTNARFTLQSGFAPFNYAIALNEKGSHVVHQYVGQEPSGRHYNDIILDSRKKPHNPMINSGAMAICSILKEEVKMADRFDQLFSIYKKMAGGDYVGFSNTTYLSERATADRNFALAHYLRENKCLGGVKLNEMLELYFQLCSIEITSDSGSVFAATLANGGVCPLSGEKLFDANCARDVLSLMYSCGMNNYSGQFSFNDFEVGLPAKSGVSGVIMVVVPDVMGICLYSPLLDEHANSVRGVYFCTELVRRFSFHNYDNLKHTFRKTNPTKRHDESKAEQIVNLLFSAATGDVSAMRRYWMEGLDMSLGDYDGRTALHLAAAEGWKSCVNFLLNKCRVNHVPRDRSCSVENENNYEDNRATWIKRNMGSLTSLNSF